MTDYNNKLVYKLEELAEFARAEAKYKLADCERALYNLCALYNEAAEGGLITLGEHSFTQDCMFEAWRTLSNNRNWANNLLAHVSWMEGIYKSETWDVLEKHAPLSVPELDEIMPSCWGDTPDERLDYVESYSKGVSFGGGE